MNLKKRLKGVIKKGKEFIKNNKINLLMMSLPLLLMSLFIFIICFKIKYNYFNFLTPVLFTVIWIALFLGVCLSLKDIIGKIIYLVINIVFASLFLVNGVYFSMTKNFFDFNLMESTKEGAPYILDSLKNCNPLVYIYFIIIIISIVFGMKYYTKNKKNNFKSLFIVLILFTILHILTPLTYGKAHSELTWSSWRNARNIYNSYNDTNKSMKVSGFIEYEFRNFYITFLKSQEKENEEDISFLTESFVEEKNTKNKYTGMFEGKNLIIVQLEGTDDWILNKEATPTLYNMKTSGINFSNHYSYYNGGGSTFNSEFAINTGFLTPLSYTRNAYSFNRNSFPYSLANLFKEKGYSVNAFHMNTGEYYSRTVNYINWGYDNYYGLKDQGTYTDDAYTLDRELMLNEEFRELMFPEDKKFVDYIITYSGHIPFSKNKGVCKKLYELDKVEIENFEDKDMTEEECVYRQNGETDYMMSLLLDTLKEKNLINDTVIVVVTDHYLYTIEDQSILDKYKETSNNLINKTPFFIWSNNIKKATIKEVTSQLNVLPTILNLFGIDYSVNNYIGEDALNPKYKGIVFFSDYSWYDGNVYVDGGVVTNNKRIKNEDLENKNYKISYLTKKNDLALKYNYFNR